MIADLDTAGGFRLFSSCEPGQRELAGRSGSQGGRLIAGRYSRLSVGATGNAYRRALEVILSGRL